MTSTPVRLELVMPVVHERCALVSDALLRGARLADRSIEGRRLGPVFLDLQVAERALNRPVMVARMRAQEARRVRVAEALRSAAAAS